MKLSATYRTTNTDIFYCKITCRIFPATVSLKEDSLYSTITKCHLRQLYCEPYNTEKHSIRALLALRPPLLLRLY